jgi:glycogen debranching enzyme
VACSPQTWAAGALFLLLQACLGLAVDGPGNRITLTDPTLPVELDQLNIRHLHVADAIVDLNLFRQGDAIAVTVFRKVGSVDVVVQH